MAFNININNGEGMGAHYSFPTSPTTNSPYSYSLPTSPVMMPAVMSNCVQYASVGQQPPYSSPPFSTYCYGASTTTKRGREQQCEDDSSPAKKKSRDNNLNSVIEDVIVRLGRQGSIDDNMQSKILQQPCDPVRSFVRRRLELSQSKQNLMSEN